MLRPNVEKALWNRGLRLVAGIDEVGRGALAGPLIAAAVIFPPKQPIPEGINDSKLLTAPKRLLLAIKIIKTATVVGFGKAPPQVIDHLGITRATQQAFHQAVKDLDVTPDFIITDAYPVEKLKNIKQKAVIKGDRRVVSVAAASILAKVYRDWLMAEVYHRQHPDYNFRKHKGYGTKEHRELIKQWGVCAIHRKSYLKSLL